MAIDYTLNWTDDTLKSPFTLTGSTVDTSTTSLALTGKGYVNWGERLQENLLHLLENFASGNIPSHPTTGQMWYDSTNNQLKLKTPAADWVIVWPQTGGGPVGGDAILDTSGNAILDTSGNGITSV